MTYSFFVKIGKDDFHYRRMCQALRDHNISILSNNNIKCEEHPEEVFWSLVKSHQRQHIPSLQSTSPSSGFHPDLHEMHDDLPWLDFEVGYQLEACISLNHLNEYTITREFLQRLGGLDPAAAKSLLVNVAESKKKFHDPMDVFRSHDLRRSRKSRIPRGCVLVHSVTVTPATMYILTPTVEISNREIRKYSTHSDRFLRVKFSDESFYGKLRSPRDDTANELFNRVRRVMRNGIRIAGRHYEFLAFGNSQFRENGAWFFAPTSTLTASDMRARMGKFDHIDVVAKYLSRIGQCFSTTRAITSVGANLNVQKIDDVSRNGYCFTDGVGKISPFLAQMIGGEFGISSDDYPSLFQFRMGGCKGVLAVDPTLPGMTVAIRPSQEKFNATTKGLEIIRTSAFASSYLNQQIILVLSALGVGDGPFLTKLRSMLENIERAMVDQKTALEMLQKNVDMNHVTLALAEMVLNGFMEVQDPFCISILQLWRAWSVKYLKEKAKILIDKGAFLLGCVDETATLNMNPGELPEIFLQIPDPDKQGAYKVVEGVCVLARNPSLHPGDVRVVHAVTCPALRHLKNVVVLPQKGERDLANMCSGGDLDGDDYLVIWDEDLLPTEQNQEPMDYTAPDPVRADGPVTVDDMTKFFVTYMRNDNLPQIAVNHRAFADSSWDGVKSDNCKFGSIVPIG